MNDYSRRWHDTSFAVENLEQQRMQAFVKCAHLAETTWAKEPLIMSHVSALQLLGVELPRISERSFKVGNIHVCTPRNATRSRRKGVTYHTWDHAFIPQSVGERLQCVPPITAWAQMGMVLATTELAVLGDSMMRNNPRLKRAGIDDFNQFMEDTPMFRGRKNCRAALALMAENTDSSQETRTRLLMLKYGLPLPVVNFQVFDEERHQIYSLDMAYLEKKVGIEYDGEHHFNDPRQRDNDDFKRSRLRRMGWKIITITSKDLLYRDRWNAKVAEILEALG